tara:strand:- start:824 stop:1021 length:198 start_codon:yes stop_codon:yes gene_type:complete
MKQYKNWTDVLMESNKNLTDALLDIAKLPSFVDPMFNYADELAWQHQLQLEQQQREEEEESGGNN